MLNLALPVYCGSDIGSIKRFTEEDFCASDVIGFLKVHTDVNLYKM